MPVLRLQIPGQEPASYAVTGPRVTIGRRADNTIQVLDGSISGHHAEFLFVDGHYRLHDLGSTNLSFVEGEAVTDFHLRETRKISFGNVTGEFDVSEDEPRLTGPQMEKDMAFLRADNLELQQKADALQRQIDMLSGARLITSKSDAQAAAVPMDTRKLIVERDELRYQNSGLLMEIERLRDELAATARERDQARLREHGASFKVLDSPTKTVPLHRAS